MEWGRVGEVGAKAGSQDSAEQLRRGSAAESGPLPVWINQNGTWPHPVVTYGPCAVGRIVLGWT